MIEVTTALFISAFIAGVLMFLAPCTLPLIPAYLAFISGVKPEELNDPATAAKARRSIVFNGLTFVIGFSLVFITFGMLAGFFGSLIGQFRGVLTQVGGVFIIIFGLMVLGAIPLSKFFSGRGLPTPTILKPGNPLSALVIGATFALGWTPCVGPVLASVLFLATTEATVFSGGLLLAVFSLGMAVPFLLTAILYSRAAAMLTHSEVLLRWVSYIGGLFLILIGILLLTDNFGLTVEYGYKLFDIIGVDGLFDYL